MSVTAAEALAAVRTRIGTATTLSSAVYWQGDDAPILPDTPAPFAFVVWDNHGSGGSPIAFGGGQGNNLYRNSALVTAYVFSPSGEGASVVMGYAESFAARLRSYRDANISCFSADVELIGPGSSISVSGLNNEVNNYQCAVAEISLMFDQIG